jgi:predicted RecA/RadA family phage recombinase
MRGYYTAHVSCNQRARLERPSDHFEEPFMKASPRAVLFTLAFATATACGGRQVEVRTAPTVSSELAVQVTNNLSQAVNVYVTPSGGQELFLRQVPANTVEKVPVQGVASGSMVVVKAVTADGSRTYQSRNVALSGLFVWSIP